MFKYEYPPSRSLCAFLHPPCFLSILSSLWNVVNMCRHQFQTKYWGLEMHVAFLYRYVDEGSHLTWTTALSHPCRQRSGSAHHQERLLPQINSYMRDEIKEWITTKGKQVNLLRAVVCGRGHSFILLDLTSFGC